MLIFSIYPCSMVHRRIDISISHVSAGNSLRIWSEVKTTLVLRRGKHQKQLGVEKMASNLFVSSYVCLASFSFFLFLGQIWHPFLWDSFGLWGWCCTVSRLHEVPSLSLIKNLYADFNCSNFRSTGHYNGMCLWNFRTEKNYIV